MFHVEHKFNKITHKGNYNSITKKASKSQKLKLYSLRRVVDNMLKIIKIYVSYLILKQKATS